MTRKFLAIALALAVGAGFAGADAVQLDLSNSFNVDAWVGPLEMQAIYDYAAANDPDLDLMELQGDLPTSDVGLSIVMTGRMLVGASTTGGYDETYSTSAQWFHPLYVSDIEGTPEDGILTGADGRDYHIASTTGNATLTGNWLEVADPGLAWDIQKNAIVAGAYHRTEDWQISSVTIELPANQKGKYADVNFVLAAMDAADRARNMRIVALYGATGTDTEVLYSFSTADGGSGPIMDEQSGGIDFTIVENVSKSYAKDSGPTGTVSTLAGSLYEFDTPLTLDASKDLWGFRIEDVDPTLNNNARGLVVFAASATPAIVQLDISNAFNVDAWVGPLEMQAIYDYATANDPDLDLMELQGDLPTDDVGLSILISGRMLIGASTTGGYNETYSTSAQWFHPLYVSDTEGTPEDGVLTGSDGREYHIASTTGNATLAGNWLEVADPGLTWDIQENTIVAGAYHRTEDWQISSVTIELPADQKGKYADVNFVLAAMDAADRARNMRIVALYGSTGADTEVLYSFSTADGGSGPMMDEQSGGTDFAIVENVSKCYAKDSGPTGTVSTQNGSLYEFDTPLTLDDTKDLWGFKIEDVDPTLNNNARGLVILAATASAGAGTSTPPANVAPTADAGTDQTVNDTDDSGAETVTLDGSGSSDSDGTISSYVWEENSTQIATGVSPSVSLAVGAHTIDLTVTDDDSDTDSDSVVITVTAYVNIAPVADAGADQFVTDNDDDDSETVTLDGTGSSDSDGTISSYVWEENSTQIATGASPSVSLGIRMHDITLTVTDNDGATDSDTVSVRVYAKALPVRLDLSNGFNMDVWLGPLEIQAIYDYQVAYDPDQDLMELQGGLTDGVGWGVLTAGNLLVGDSTETGYSETYSISTNWFHPQYISNTEGTPEDGVITGGDGREYNLPSTLGNTTYAGNALEVADPGLAWNTQPNAVVIGASHNINDWQIASATIELPAAQKASYTDVNFLLTANNAADRARNMRIVALYGASGTDEEILFSFATADGGSGPMMTESTGDSDFDIAYTFTKSYGNSNGPTGAITTTGGSFYEFTTAITLNSSKTLWGFKIEDTNPTLTNNARGLTLFAASATSTSTMGVNAPPTADAGADQTVTDTDNNSTESISLDGSGSADTDGDIASWIWTENSSQIATGETPAAITLGVGVHDITLTVTDNESATDADTVTITINACPGFKTYYVDYDSGADTNNGLSNLTPWQHCPGDANATDTAGSTSLNYGDTILFKGGVTYRGEITANWSGNSTARITYDGNTADTWGTGRAIIDGSVEVTGWTQCTSAAEVDGNPNYANIYWTYVPAGTTAFNADFYEDDARLHPAQHPNVSNSFYHDNLDDYLEFDSYTTTTITDTSYFTMADSTYWDGSTYVYIHGGNNGIYRRAVTGYNPATSTITFDEFDSVFYTEYAMVNSLKILDTAGELVVREDQTDANGRPKVYIWPLTTGVSGKTFDVSNEKGSFNLGSQSYINVQGFTLTKSTDAKAAVYNTVNQSCTDITVDDNIVIYHASSGIGLDDIVNCVASNNEVRYCRGRGIILTDVTDSSIEDNWIHNGGETAIDYYGAVDSSITGNLVEDNLGLHANGITCYEWCEDILIFGNRVSGGRAACTVGDGTNLTVAYNILDGNNILYAFADWRNINGLYLYNNIITKGGTAISSTSTNVVSKNNIMAGSPVAYRGGTSEYNIYTSLSWTQDPNDLETGEFEATESELFVDAANGDYTLKSTSPAIDAGVNVGLTADLIGTSVPQNSIPDVGPLEYQP